MYKRAVVFFSLLMVLLGVGIINTYKISHGDILCDAAAQQSSYKLKVATIRGNIYDCNKKQLVSKTEETFISVLPEFNTMTALSQLLNEEERQFALEKVKDGKPFVMRLADEKQLIAKGVSTFKVPRRYSDNGNLAPHIIGYLDGDMQGVCGIEKSFNDYLNNATGNIFVKHKVDALNRRIPGERSVIENTMYKCSKGVVLTLDERVQKIAQSAAEKYIKKGAIIVAEVPNCEIRACVSMPTFSPTDVAVVLNDADSPLLNRALLPYNIGSVFKLVTAAAILESDLDPCEIYHCTGSCTVDQHEFHCFNNKPHDDIDLEKALALSCNTYFIDKAIAIGGEKLLEVSRKFGLGKELELAPDMVSKEGVLPSKESLACERTLANFSFGQGKLLVTPMQATALINTIASGGLYCEPRLVVGLVNENLNFVQKTAKPKPVRVLAEGHASSLLRAMEASVEYGTSAKGKPDVGAAAAKTGTAQTGIKVDDRSVVQAWYAGVYPADAPKYVIVTFAEDAKGGGESCGPAFKKIAHDIFYEILKCG